jgi:type II secretory pathway pseudopilin PulG
MRRAFTLIELIVIAAILGVLIGLALPALGSAMREARRIQCATSLRSLNQGLRMYMDMENRGIFPAVPSFNPNWRNQSFTQVYGVIEPYLDSAHPRRQNADDDWVSGPPFVCPADNTVAWEFGYSYSFWPGSLMTSLRDPNLVFPERARRVTMQYEMPSPASPGWVWMDAEGWHTEGPGKHLQFHGAKYMLAAFYDGSVDWAIMPRLRRGRPR